MMITPAMMEQLGGKRGEARGPDMTNVVVSEASAADEYGGASTLEESLGDWDDGRKKKKKTKKNKSKSKPKKGGAAARPPDFDSSCTAFRLGNERLRVTADSVQGYILGLLRLCEGHDLVATRMMEALGQIDALAEAGREYHDMSSWSRTADPNSKASRMQEMMETLVHEPIARHLETREALLGRLDKAKKKEQPQLMDEMKTFEESLASVMNKPFEALRRMQIEFMSEAARATAGGADAGLGDISISAAMTERGRGLTGKTGFTPRPGAEEEVAVSEGIPPEGVPPEPRQTAEDIWSNIMAQCWDGPAIDSAMLDSSPPCLGLFAQLGWKDAQPTLFATLKNSSALGISGIRIEMVHSTPLQVSCKKPLVVANLAPGAEKRMCATLSLGSAAAASSPPEDEFDSFFGERDAVTTLDDDTDASKPREVQSWAVDPTCTSASSVTIKISTSLQVSTVDVSLPYHLFLKGHSKLTWAEFVELWNSPEPAPEPQSPADELEPDDGTTKICVRIEEPPEIIGYTRFDPDTNLDVMRQMLLADAALKRRLPAEWVFVKKGAPVGKKAEIRWRVADVVPNAVIRDKSRPLPDEDTLQARASMKPPKQADSKAPDRKEPIPERVFTCPCEESEAGVASALAVGGMTLVGRLEEGKRKVLLLFFARAGADVHFLLQVSCGSGETAAGCTCTVRGSNTDLFDVFENCVRALLGTSPGIVNLQEIPGAGEPFYGDFGGVAFEDAQDGRGNDDGYEYHDYGDTTVEQMVCDWLTAHGHGSEVEGTCLALHEADIAKDEWLQELIGIKQDGVLDKFIHTVNQHEEKKSRSQASDTGTGGYDYGDYGGASLEEALGGANGYDYGDYGGASLEDALGEDFERAGGDDGNYDFGDYGGVSLEDAIRDGADWGDFGGSSAGGGSSFGTSAPSAPPSPMRTGEAEDAFDADFAAFDDNGGFEPAERETSHHSRGLRGLTQNSSSRSLMSDGATPESEAAFGAFDADFGDGDAGADFDGRLQSGPESHVFDPDLVAEVATAGAAGTGNLPRSGLGSYDAVWAAEQRPGFRSGRRGSTDSGGSHGSHRSSVSSRSRPSSAPGTPRRITMMAGSGTVEQLEALQLAPSSQDGEDQIGRDFDEDTSFYDEVSRTEASSARASRGSPTVADYD